MVFFDENLNFKHVMSNFKLQPQKKNIWEMNKQLSIIFFLKKDLCTYLKESYTEGEADAEREIFLKLVHP